MSYLTVVFKELNTEQVAEIMEREDWVAISRDHALDDKTTLEEFIRKVAADELSDPGHEARNLMENMGWA